MSELVERARANGVLGEGAPTEAGLVAHLQARPDLAWAVARRVRVASPWTPHPENPDLFVRVAPSDFDDIAAAVTDGRELYCVVPGEDGWCWGAGDGDRDLPHGVETTRGYAMALADAALVAAGWLLAEPQP